LEGVGRQRRRVALLAEHDHAGVVRRLRDPRAAARVEPPLQHVALDHQRMQRLVNLAFSRPLRFRPYVDEQGVLPEHLLVGVPGAEPIES
jgi:hypothetical protein